MSELKDADKGVHYHYHLYGYGTGAPQAGAAGYEPPAPSTPGGPTQPGWPPPGLQAPGWQPPFPPPGGPGAAAPGPAPWAQTGHTHRHPGADSLVKGLAVGAGAAYLLTNEAAQRTVIRTALQLWAVLQGGIEELKERLHDAEAEVSAAAAHPGTPAGDTPSPSATAGGTDPTGA